MRLSQSLSRYGEVKLLSETVIYVTSEPKLASGVGNKIIFNQNPKGLTTQLLKQHPSNSISVPDHSNFTLDKPFYVFPFYLPFSNITILKIYRDTKSNGDYSVIRVFDFQTVREFYGRGVLNRTFRCIWIRLRKKNTFPLDSCPSKAPLSLRAKRLF